MFGRVAKDKKEDEEEERRRIASLIAETSYLTSVLNAPSGEATTTASSSSDDYDYYDLTLDADSIMMRDTKGRSLTSNAFNRVVLYGN